MLEDEGQPRVEAVMREIFDSPRRRFVNRSRRRPEKASISGDDGGGGNRARANEGATLVAVHTFLHDLRRTRWPERMGRKWTSRDRAVARKVLAWYRDATDEHPVKK